MDEDSLESIILQKIHRTYQENVKQERYPKVAMRVKGTVSKWNKTVEPPLVLQSQTDRTLEVLHSYLHWQLLEEM